MEWDRFDRRERGEVRHWNFHSLNDMQQRKGLLRVRILLKRDISPVELAYFCNAAKLATAPLYNGITLKDREIRRPETNSVFSWRRAQRRSPAAGADCTTISVNHLAAESARAAASEDPLCML
ncbi:hypothetical protein EVAR_92389_1 [Eumeta japonica]|uniref:Uncharacterized protein n=1 Tax=Eumeta variegata TaxID=151549 RepID=A0A4C1TM56_EUMVA|nr:hypothetical protein EVAR_92389_1 [Eumeta japonica]